MNIDSRAEHYLESQRGNGKTGALSDRQNRSFLVAFVNLDASADRSGQSTTFVSLGSAAVSIQPTSVGPSQARYSYG